jgi:hypothetical protein
MGGPPALGLGLELTTPLRKKENSVTTCIIHYGRGLDW